MTRAGRTGGNRPDEVLAGVCVEDRDLWNLICEVREAEETFFGRRITPGSRELKARRLLKPKTFRLAGQMPPLEPEERARLAASCLSKGEAARKAGRQDSGASRAELTALAQAKIAFVERLLELCGRYRVKAFASIVDRNAPRPAGHDMLRKDYSYLFERYFYFLEEQPAHEMGLVVFDELERSQAHMLVDQMALYFLDTARGRMRASRIVPEPFFVHSDLTTAIQLADIVAYVVCWAVRFGPLTAPSRPELKGLADRVCELRHWTIREEGGEQYRRWSFVPIQDLRPRSERL